MFEVKNDLSPEIVTETFLQQAQTQYNMRYHDFRTRAIRSVYHCSESILFLGPQIWNSFLSDLKQLESLNSFKKKKFEARNQKVVLVDFAKLL